VRRVALEPLAWVASLAVLAGLVVAEGRRRTDLERRVPVTAREVYRLLSRPQASWQVLDVRADLSAGYQDAHVPGALPMPACDPARTPAAAAARILPTVPTILVSGDGDQAALGECLARFTAARAMAGGMEAWSDAALPEDSGEYTPPSAKAGGGCL
jgi:rhodanese-related sulfurtransferase